MIQLCYQDLEIAVKVDQSTKFMQKKADKMEKKNIIWLFRSYHGDFQRLFQTCQSSFLTGRQLHPVPKTVSFDFRPWIAERKTFCFVAIDIEKCILKNDCRIQWRNDPPPKNQPYRPTYIEHVANVLTHGVSHEILDIRKFDFTNIVKYLVKNRN